MSKQNTKLREKEKKNQQERKWKVFGTLNECTDAGLPRVKKCQYL